MAKKILFINQEILPYVPKSEMSSVGYELPNMMLESGCEVRTFMPKWGNINERRGQLHEVIRLSGMNLIVNDTDHPLVIKVASIPQTRLQVYFIDNEDFFMKRRMTADEDGAECADNGERAIFFARGVIETVKKLRWSPDIIQCQGWISAVVPLYVKKAYKSEPIFANTKVVTSLFQNRLQSNMEESFKKCMEFRDANSRTLKKYKNIFDYEELMRLSIDFSDAVVEIEPNAGGSLIDYAKESGKAVLGYSESTNAKTYQELYDSLEK